jgi:hypothetical protein
VGKIGADDVEDLLEDTPNFGGCIGIPIGQHKRRNARGKGSSRAEKKSDCPREKVEEILHFGVSRWNYFDEKVGRTPEIIDRNGEGIGRRATLYDMNDVHELPPSAGKKSIKEKRAGQHHPEKPSSKRTHQVLILNLFRSAYPLLDP